MTHFDIIDGNNIFTADNLKGGHSVTIEHTNGEWVAALSLGGGVAYTSPINFDRRRWSDRLTAPQGHLNNTQREALLDGLMALA